MFGRKERLSTSERVGPQIRPWNPEEIDKNIANKEIAVKVKELIDDLASSLEGNRDFQQTTATEFFTGTHTSRSVDARDPWSNFVKFGGYSIGYTAYYTTGDPNGNLRRGRQVRMAIKEIGVMEGKAQRIELAVNFGADREEIEAGRVAVTTFVDGKTEYSVNSPQAFEKAQQILAPLLEQPK